MKKTFRLTAIIFTAIVIIQLLFNNLLTNEMLWELLAFAFVAAALRYAFFHKKTLGGQAAYLATLWLLMIPANYLFEWRMSAAKVAANAVVIAITYVFIAFFMYQRDKVEVAEMNERLAQLRNKRN